MKRLSRKQNRLLAISLCAIAAVAIVVNSFGKSKEKGKREIASCCTNPSANHVCVMKTILGIDSSEEGKKISSFVTDPMVTAALEKGMDWIAKAQATDGGWGSGSHDRQNEKNPHAVKTDPATTSLVGMSLLRNDNTLFKGKYAEALRKGTEYLLKAVEECPSNRLQITTVTNTQPQTKLGKNIDVILTCQFFTNLLRYNLEDAELKSRIEKAVDKCIEKIQKAQSDDGGWQDGGWAPVLQSALANNALESADDVGRKVDTSVLKKSREYQNKNFDAETKSVLTSDAAGVVLYSISSSSRASAKDAKKAKAAIDKAKKENKLSDTASVSQENLVIAGLSSFEAQNYSSAFKMNKAANAEATKADVMAGFGSNGGEEFLSYLMTGESMLMQGGNDFKKWYDMMSGKLVNIQGKDGSWNGHHCITSPVFCTATCLLILSIHNDMQFTIQMNK